VGVMVRDPKTGAWMSAKEYNSYRAEYHRKLDAAKAAANQEYKHQVFLAGCRDIAARYGADTNSVVNAFLTYKERFMEENKKAYPNYSRIPKPEQSFTYTAGNNTKPMQFSASTVKTPSSSYLAQQSSLTALQKPIQFPASTVKTPSSSYLAQQSSLTAVQRHQQSLVNKIYSGRSTNGNDVITGQGYIDGGEGDDKIIGSAGSDLIYGGAGNDVITSGRGRDYIFGGAGNDIIDLRNSGVSTADGGTGIDTFILGKGNGSAIQGYNPKEDRIDARECGIGDLRMQNGSIYIIAHGERGGSSIAWLEGISYQLTGNLKTDCQNLGITANQIGY